MKSIGEKIKEMRTKLGITQKELAEKVEINIKSIQRYESNESHPDSYAIVKIASYFGVSTDYLYGIVGLKEEKQMMYNNMNTEFYKIYINSREKNRIDKNAEYYWISYEKGIRWAYTKWAGFTDENFKFEIRKISVIPPLYAVDLCEKMYGKQMMIINESDEAKVFCIVGGHAIVKKEICQKYLPEFVVPLIVKVNKCLLT